ncbi:MAG: Cell death protease [Sclerophora amabilis]|nr:MAG: Cell death protease [Sclerophora amabilis]
MRFSALWPPSRRRGSSSVPNSLAWGVFSLLVFSTEAWADKTAADYFVHSLPGAPDGPLLKMHAGHIEVDPDNKGNLFFWHFQNQHIANRQRTVIWLNGGPGCSSLDGAMMEVGPYRVKEDGNLRYNKGSWDEFTNLLFVDNPVGTGFSYVSTDHYVKELKEMADQFIIFLTKFFTLFPEYEHDDIYIAGESYAGQHIPYIAQAMLDRNKGPSVKHKWMLEGLLMGNGWIAPMEQYMSYLPFAYKEKLVQGGSDVAKKLEAQQAICTKKLNEDSDSHHVDIPDCEQILEQILKLTQDQDTKHNDKKCVNMYDIRLRDAYPSCGMSWPPDLAQVTPYLRRQDVVKALHVNPDKRTGWTECAGEVSRTFRAQKSKASIDLLPSLLEEVPVLLFSGAKDLICNHLGTEELINNMKWNGGKGFELSPGTWAPRRDWTFEDDAAGLWQEARNLTYVLFYNSSHMVPFDYPRRTRDMLDRFIGVDIASIGGAPADSRIDGEKGLETSVGGHPNSTLAQEKESKKVNEAAKSAYWTSAEYAFFFLFVVFACGGGYLCYVKQRHRRRHEQFGYQGLFGGESTPNINNGRGGTPTRAVRRGGGLENFRHKRGGIDDVEAADYDESELDDLHVVRTPPTGSSDDSGGAGGTTTTAAAAGARAGSGLTGEKDAGDMTQERYSIGSGGSRSSRSSMVGTRRD